MQSRRESFRKTAVDLANRVRSAFDGNREGTDGDRSASSSGTLVRGGVAEFIGTFALVLASTSAIVPMNSATTARTRAPLKLALLSPETYRERYGMSKDQLRGL